MVTRCNSCGSVEQTEWVTEEEPTAKEEIERCAVCKCYDLTEFDEDDVRQQEDNYGNEM